MSKRSIDEKLQNLIRQKDETKLRIRKIQRELEALRIQVFHEVLCAERLIEELYAELANLED